MDDPSKSGKAVGPPKDSTHSGPLTAGQAPKDPSEAFKRKPLDAPDASTPPLTVAEPTAGPQAPDDPTPAQATWSVAAAFHEVLTHKAGREACKRGRVIVDQFGLPYVELWGGGNPYLVRVGSAECLALIRQVLPEAGKQPNKSNVAEALEGLKAKADVNAVPVTVWRRVGRRDDGTIVINLGDQGNTQVWITPGKVDIVSAGSDVLFARTPQMLPMPLPAAGPGSHRLLRKYVNLTPVSFMLYIGWITFVLAHPKGPGSRYVLLVLNGGQGSGKSQITRATILVIDPSRIGLQVMPRNVNDLAVAGQNAHVLAFDNVRDISAAMSDLLCVASTGGDVAKRQLYTDGDVHVLNLHFAVILNGIPSFVEQPDLAQRSLVLRLQLLEESKRRPEADIWAEFDADRPVILRGLFELIAKVLAKLPEATVTHPARMRDFCRWLAAMELVAGAPAGTYQQEYVAALHEGQRDSLQENVLGSALLDNISRLTQDGTELWLGTPAELLEWLSDQVSQATQRSRDWPANPIALSKRLQFLQAPFMTQGVEIQFRRSKERLIGIKKIGGADLST